MRVIITTILLGVYSVFLTIYSYFDGVGGKEFRMIHTTDYIGGTFFVIWIIIFLYWIKIFPFKNAK